MFVYQMSDLPCDDTGRSAHFEGKTVPGLYDPADPGIMDILDRDLLRILQIEVQTEQSGTDIRDIVVAADSIDDPTDEFFPVLRIDEFKGQTAIVEDRRKQEDRKCEETDDDDHLQGMRQIRIPDIDDEIRKASRHRRDRIGAQCAVAQEGSETDESS